MDAANSLSVLKKNTKSEKIPVSSQRLGPILSFTLANNQLRLSLYQLPAESQTHRLSCVGQEFTIAFAGQ